MPNNQKWLKSLNILLLALYIYAMKQLKRVTQLCVTVEKHSTEIIFDYDDYVMYIQDDMENNNQVEYTALAQLYGILIHDELFLLLTYLYIRIYMWHTTYRNVLHERQHIQNENGNICSVRLR